jgi:hypothetical protein
VHSESNALFQDFCKTMVAANMPLNKLNSKNFWAFLKKCNILQEPSSRKTYLGEYCHLALGNI